jgi:hypothetical protein
MLKRLINGEIAIGCAIATLFWIAVLVWATSYAPTDAEKQSCYQAAKQSGRQTGECKTFWERTTSDPIALFTLVLAFSTVGLWVSTIGLYRASERQLGLASETAQRELRAYIVGTSSAQMRGFNGPRPICLLSFKNAGQTPAFNVSVWTSNAVAAYPMENPPAPPNHTPEEESSVGVVAPGGEFHNEIVSDIEVTAAERAEVIAGRCAFYIYGKISYRDSFGIERTATFCHFFAGDRARGNNGPLATYHKWNVAT